MADRRVLTATAAVLEEAAVEEFQAGLRGQLLRPGEDGYDEARRVFNAMIDKHPALIARCTGVADVINAVNFARDNKLLVAVRGGGHSVAGKSVSDGGILIDLSPMKGMRVDPNTRTARAEPGLTWGEFDRETQAFGLATTGGAVTTTGIAGLTLGGGIGWLNGKHGLACDNLLSADVVTADGQLLSASANENADLFWGLRGGGGNFGVVTSFEYQLHPVGPVLGGLLLHPAARAKELFRFYREFTSAVPDELTIYPFVIIAPPETFIPEHLRGAPVSGMGLCYAGPLEEGEEVIRPLREFGPPEVDLVEPMPYTAHQAIMDGLNQPGRDNYWKSHFLRDLTDEAIDVIADHTALLSPFTQVFLEHLHGATKKVAPDGTAFGQRNGDYNFSIFSIWSDPLESDRHIQWTREFWTAMRPFASGGAYVNYLSEDEGDRVKSAYGPNYDRLAALKNKYDPTNLFRLNQNIEPTGGQG